MKVSNKNYVNIIEKSGGQKPTNAATNHTIDNDKQAVELICTSYRNHPSMLKITFNITTKGIINDNTIFSPMSSNEVGKRLQQLNPSNDKIPPTLIKIAAEPFSTPLSIAINNTFKHNIFPSYAKVARVKPLDKKEGKQTLFFIFPTSLYFEYFIKNL